MVICIGHVTSTLGTSKTQNKKDHIDNPQSTEQFNLNYQPLEVYFTIFQSIEIVSLYRDPHFQ